MFIAYECYPHNRQSSTIGAQRPYQFAKWLNKLGWSCIILCADRDRRRTLSKKEYVAAISKTVEDSLKNWDKQSVLTVAVPTLRFANFWDMVWIKSANKNPNGSFGYTNVISQTIGKLASLCKLTQGDYSQDFVLPAKRAVQAISKKIKLNWVVAEHGPDASLFVSAWMNKKLSIKWIVDFRDPIFQPYSGIRFYLYHRVIKKLLRSAQATINVSCEWAKLDKEIFQKPSYVITNGFDEEEFDRNRQHLKKRKLLKFTYTGNIYLPFQQTTLFFQFLEHLKNKQIAFVFTYWGNCSEYVTQKAEQFGVLQNCEIHSFGSRERVIEEMISADYLVVFPMSSPDNLYYKDGLLPGKIFEYMGTQVPILCFSEFDTILEKTIKRTDCGLVFKTVSDATIFVTSNTPPQQNKLEVSKFSRRATAERLQEILLTGNI